MQNSAPIWLGVLAAAGFACFLADNAAHGQDKAPKPNAHAPTIAAVFPSGAQPGTTVELTITGSKLDAPTTAWFGGRAKINILREKDNGKDPNKLKAILEVPPDTPPGYYPLRVATEQGISNVALFCIDPLPQRAEEAGNHSRQSAQVVDVPCVIMGQIDHVATDYFKIRAKSDGQLTAEVIARRLGSPLDPQLMIYDAQTGRELVYAGDSPGLQSDARLSFKVRRDGEYLIAVKDVLNRGGDTFRYRLRIGDIPLATAPMPLAAKEGSRQTVSFLGPNISDSMVVENLNIPSAKDQSAVWVSATAGQGHASWPVPLHISRFDQQMETEPNNEPEKANRITLPIGITGRLRQDRDRDYFSFSAKKGQVIRMQAETLRLGLPTVVYMVVSDENGKELERTNPEAQPPHHQRIDFTAPADGEYRIRVENLNLMGGPEEAYYLEVFEKTPTFRLKLGLDRWDLAAGETQVLPIRVERDGYSGPITLNVQSDHPGLSGSAMIAPEAKSGDLILRAKADVPPGAYALTIVGSAEVDGRQIRELVSVEDALSDSLAGLPFPPAHIVNTVGIGVRPRPPFQILVQLNQPEAVPGLRASATITVKRDDGFEEPINIEQPEGLPGNAKVRGLKPIPKDQNSIKIALPIDAKTPLGELLVRFSANAKYKGKETHSYAEPLRIAITRPLALKVEPAELAIKPGTKATLKVTAQRKGGYNGPIKLEIQNLPANVSAPEVMIPKGQSAAEVEITAAANANGDRTDVHIVGTATEANSQQQSSNNVTVRVQKE